MIRVKLGLVCLLLSTTAAAAPVFEKNLVPPHALDGIRAGMALVELPPAFTQFQPDAAYQDAAGRRRLIKDAGGGARYYVLIKDDVVSRIGIEAPEAGLVGKLTRLWGKPVVANNLANEAITSWVTSGAATTDGSSLRVDLACRGGLCRLAFHHLLTAEFFGTEVHPPGALAVVRPWMQRGELAKLAPHHVAGTDVPAGPEDVRLGIDVARDGHLRSVLVAGLPPNTRSLIEQAWGAPTETATGPIWWNPHAGWRARYDESLHTVTLFPYVPAARLLGAGVTIAAFAHPVLGATRDQLAKAYPSMQLTAQGGSLALPPIEDGLLLTPATVKLDPRTGRVMLLALHLPFATPARRDELAALMEAKWGRAARANSSLAFPASKQVHIQATETPSEWVVTLEL
jgi:hypothetical protein